MNIIVPGWGGFRLTAQSPSLAADLEYPMAWEAQLVIIEGQDRGFYVWADDAAGRYKRIRIRLKPDGWWIGFTTWNNAPFEDLDACQTVKWRVSVYEGNLALGRELRAALPDRCPGPQRNVTADWARWGEPLLLPK